MKRPSRSSLVQGATLLLLIGCAGFFTHRLSTLADTQQARQTAEQIHRLQQQLQRIDHELEGMQPFKGVLKEDFQQTRQSLLKRLAALESTARAVEALTSNLTVMKAQLQDNESALLMLKAAAEKCPTACTSATRPTDPPPRLKARSKTPVTARPSPPPFTLLGLESRAGESFLAVIPQGLQRLGDVQLLRPGMLLQGWKLTALDPGKAHWLRPDGVLATLSIP